MITYQTEYFADILSEMVPLLTQHYDEIALYKEKMVLNPDYEAYAKLEELGMLHIFTVRDDGKLIGYFVSFLNRHIHYKDHLIALNDVLYIHPDYRGRMLGARMFKKVEAVLKGLGVSAIVLHAKTTHDFGSMVKRLGYSHVENQYSKYIGE